MPVPASCCISLRAPYRPDSNSGFLVGYRWSPRVGTLFRNLKYFVDSLIFWLLHFVCRVERGKKEDFNWCNSLNNSATIFYAPRCIADVISSVLNNNTIIINCNNRLSWFSQTETESFLSTYQRMKTEFQTRERWVDSSEHTMPKIFDQKPFPIDRELSQWTSRSSVLYCTR